tara:strand:+ start:124 stop:633 length:510 start_codon:yes stop_codon:yes gene_type:complete
MAAELAVNGHVPESKIPLITIPSDDCVVRTGQVIKDGEIIDEGQAYHVHKGESIQIIPVMTVGELIALGRLQSATVGEGAAEALGTQMGNLCLELSQRIISWNWTDLMGQPMAQPYQRPDILGSLTNDELLYLVVAAQGRETPEERNLDSGQSASTSSTPKAASPSRQR